MANDPKYYNGNEVLLYFDTTTAITTPVADVNIPGNFGLVVCLTDNNFSSQTAAIDTTSKCVPGWADSMPGVQSATFSANGIAVRDSATGASEFNMNDIFILKRNKTKFFAATYDNASGTVRMALVYISQYDDTNPTNDKKTWSITLTACGEVVDQVSTT